MAKPVKPVTFKFGSQGVDDFLHSSEDNGGSETYSTTVCSATMFVLARPRCGDFSPNPKHSL